MQISKLSLSNLIHEAEVGTAKCFLRRIGRVAPEYAGGIFDKMLDKRSAKIMKLRYIERLGWGEICGSDGVYKCSSQVYKLHKKAIETLIG